MTDDGVVVLGTQLAAARAAQERHVPPGPSPIADVDYPAGSGDMWRWIDCPQDAAMSAFVREFATAGAPDRATMRASLSMDDLYTVLLFARRRGFAAIRTEDVTAAGEAFDALSAIDLERVDWRDVVVAAALAAYAAECAGAVAATVAEEAIGRADSQVAEVLAEVVGQEIDLAEMCGYRVVDTAGGPVLFEDDYEHYEPERDLARIALRLATAIEAEAGYRVEGLSVADTIAGIWVGADDDAEVSAAIENLTGCASINSTPVDGPGLAPRDHFLNVYLAEAATAEDAAALARGAGRGGRQGSVVLGVHVDRLCAVFVAACTRYGEPSLETRETMDRFRPMALAATGER